MSLATWITPSYWQQLLPNLHIHDIPFMTEAPAFDILDATSRELEALLIREGYFQIGPLDWSLPMPALAQAVITLERHRWMPVFAFLYDEYWLLFHKLKKVLAGLLGADFQLLPDFWAWHIDPQQAQSGWKPHRDKKGGTLLPDGRPKSLTVWIPLTDATPLNGCLYVVPCDRDPTYNLSNHDDWQFHLGDIRALPAAAGSVLCWNSEVLHWGAHSSPRAQQPRISVAYEYQRGDVEPYNQPLMPSGTVPNFPSRLRLVAKQILQYRHMYPLTPEMESLAQHVLGNT